MAYDDDFENVEVDRVIHTTAKAILVRLDDTDYWIPKSQVYRPDEVRRSKQPVMLRVTAWWLEVNELEHFARHSRYYRQPPPESSSDLPEAHRVYRRLAAKYHPDRSQDTQEFMKDLNELWQAVLLGTRKK